MWPYVYVPVLHPEILAESLGSGGGGGGGGWRWKVLTGHVLIVLPATPQHQ